MESKTFGNIQHEQLNAYAAELAGLYDALRSKSRVWLEAEGRLRTRGTHSETLGEVLCAAHICGQLILEDGLLPKDRKAVAGRLLSSLDRAMELLREYEKESGTYGRDDLGLAALLRQEIYRVASQYGWDIQMETDTVSPCALSETAAYLIVREALQHLALNPRTQQVTLTLRAIGERLIITLIACDDGAEPVESPDRETTGVFLTRLYARFAGGSCSWRTSSSDLKTATEMELTLPLGTSELPRGHREEQILAKVDD
ncbi:MAG: hypothetical protein ACE5JL_01325 [Dehalococcoidia bacterium]